MRLTYEELNELCKKFNTDRLWSWSRVNCPHNSLYEYFLKYIIKAKEDRLDSIYVNTGGMSHDALEKYYTKEIPYEKMIEEFEDGWSTAMIAELKFDRNDSTKNKSIQEKYYYDLQHFFKNHVSIKTKMITEQFVTLKIGDEYFQGYIDALTKDDDGNYHILDWKTSSIYLGDKAKNECGQLVMYAMALHQKGIPYEKIKIAWDFLKYVNVYVEPPKKINLSWTTVKGEEKNKEKLDQSKLISTIKASAKAWLKEVGYDKIQIEEIINQMVEKDDINTLPKEVRDKFIIEEINEEITPRHIERCKIGESLQANVKAQMKKLGYDEDEVFSYLDMLIQTNNISVLPEDVQSKYRFDDCFVYVDLTDELLKRWENYIVDTVKMLREKEADYAKNKDETIWYEDEESVKEQSYYFANLCGYSAKLHKPYKMYLDKLDAEKNGDIFGGTKKSEESDEYAEDDMSWLENL